MITAFWQQDLLTMEEFVALPEDNSRLFELQDGVLVVSPLPGTLHQMVRFQMATALDRQLPPDWEVIPAVEVVTRADFPSCVRVPDVVVVSVEALAAYPPRFVADQVLLAVEIVWPGSRATDTVLKPVEYAKAGIKHYWVVDLDGPISLTQYHLNDDFEYQKEPVVTGVFATTNPFPMTIDLATLSGRSERTKVDQ